MGRLGPLLWACFLCLLGYGDCAHFAYSTMSWSRSNLNTFSYDIQAEFAFKSHHGAWVGKYLYPKPNWVATAAGVTSLNSLSDSGVSMPTNPMGPENIDKIIPRLQVAWGVTDKTPPVLLSTPFNIWIANAFDNPLMLCPWTVGASIGTCGNPITNYGNKCAYRVATANNYPSAINSNWWLAKFNMTVPATAAQTNVLTFYDCCRLDGSYGIPIQTGGDQWWRISMAINTGVNFLWGPAAKTGYFRVYAAVNVSIVFSVPVPPDRARAYALNFFFAPTGQTAYDSSQKVSGSGMTDSPGKTGAVVGLTTGVMQWTPKCSPGVGIYMWQISIRDTASQQWTALDFVTQVIDDFTCAEQASTPANDATPKFYPALATDVCKAECLAAKGIACTACPFYPGFTATYSFSIYDCLVPLTATANTNLKLLDVDLPTGVVLVQSAAPAVQTKTWLQANAAAVYNSNSVNGIHCSSIIPCCSTNWAVTWASYSLTWKPEIDSTDQVICMQASDGVLTSLGSYCLTLELQKVNFMFVSGIVRDFTQSNMGGVRAGPADPTNFVKTQLDQSTYKPVASSPWPTLTSQLTPAAFDLWWTDKTDQTIYSIILVQKGSPTSEYYFYSPQFRPIDNRLLSVSDTPGTPNTFFTYEINTYINVTQGHTYTFRAVDDLWIFVDGRILPSWSLFGIPSDAQIPSRSYNLTGAVLNTVMQLQYAQIYRFDIFFVSRGLSDSGGVRIPGFGIMLPYTLLCSALSTGVVEFAGGDAMVFYGGANTVNNVDKTFRLGGVSNLFTLNTAWISDSGSPKLMKVFRGFNMTFEFQVTSSPCQGFAFVLTSSIPQSATTVGEKLGYSDLGRTLAVEFDMIQDTALGDPSYNHISLHVSKSSTNYLQSDLANEAYSIGRSVYETLPGSTNDVSLTFTNSSWHRIQITYSPAQQDQAGLAYGWFRVMVNNVIRPVVEARMLTSDLSAVFAPGNAAYVGFSTASKDAAMPSVNFRNVQFKIVPVSAKNTVWGVPIGKAQIIEQGVGLSQAGTVYTRRILTKDACGVQLGVGDEPQFFTVKLTSSTGAAVTWLQNPIFTTNNDGSYDMSYAFGLAGTGFRMVIMYAGSPIIMDPSGVFVSVFQVDPGQTDAVRSIFVLLGANATNTIGKFEYPASLFLRTISVTLRDSYDNLQTNPPETCTLVFSPGVSTSTDTFARTATPSVQDTTFSATVAQDYVLRVYLKGGEAIPILVSQLGGTTASKLEATLSVIAGEIVVLEAVGDGTTYAKAGKSAGFRVILTDAFANIAQRNMQQATAFVTGPSPSTTVVQLPASDYVFYTIYTMTVIGTYQLEVKLANYPLQTKPFTLVVAPGDVNGTQSKVALTSNAALAPGQTALTVTLKVGEEFTFYIAAKDMFGNMRDSDSSAVFTFDTVNPVGQYSSSFVNGVYRVTVVFSGMFVQRKMSFSINNQVIGTSVSFTVIAGSCSGAMSRMVPQTTNGTAGVNSDLLINCYDVVNNSGTIATGTVGTFQFVFRNNGIEVDSTQLRTTYTGSGTSSQEKYAVNSTVAGSLLVDLTSVVDRIGDRGQQFTINPAPTDPRSCVDPPAQVGKTPQQVGVTSTPFAGIGHLSALCGIVNISNFITIRARDKFLNVQNPGVNDNVNVTVSMDSPVFSIAVNKIGVSPDYTFTWQMGNNCGNYTVTLNVQSSPVSIWKAQASSDGSTCSITPPILGVQKVGQDVVYTFARSTEPTGATFYEGRAVSGSNVVSARTTVSKNNTLVLRFTKPGTYKLNVSSNGVDCTSGGGALADLQIAPGDLSGPTSALTNLPRVTNQVQAGTSQSYGIIPKDQFSNTLTDLGGYQFQYQISPLNSLYVNNPVFIVSGSCANYSNCGYALVSPLGSWKITVTATNNGRDPIIIDSEKYITVIPGPVNVSRSQVKCLLNGDVVAGTTVQCVAQLMDSYGNTVSKDSVDAGKLACSVSGVTFSNSSYANGGFLFSVVVTTAGSRSINVTYNSQLLPVASVTVMPAALDRIAFESSTYTAFVNTAVSIKFIQYDMYNNNIDDVQLAVAVTIQADSYQAITTATNVSIAAGYTRKAGNYTWTFTSNNGKALGTKIYTLLPGRVDMTKTILAPFVQATVGQMLGVNDLQIQLFDTFGNENSSATFNWTFTYDVFETPYPCGGFDADSVFAPISALAQFIIDWNTMSPRLLGLFLFTVAVDNVRFDDCQFFTQLNIIPGLLSHSESIVNVSQSSITAGDACEVFVLLKDENKFIINPMPSNAGAFTLVVINGGLQFSRNPVIQGNKFVLMITGTRAGNFTFQIFYNDTQKGNQALGTSNLAVQVVPGAPATFRFDASMAHNISGYPDKFSLTTVDRFGNVYSARDEIYTVDIQRIEPGYTVLSISPQYSVAAGYWLVHFTAIWSGAYKATISMKQPVLRTLTSFKIFPLTLNQTLCLQGQYRCENATNVGACSSSYATCLSPPQCAANQIKCQDGSCKDKLELCSCSGVDWVRCPSYGYCVANINLCPPVSQCPDFATSQCPNKECRVSAADCPSTLSCPSGFVTCDNGLSCAKVAEDCPALPSSCTANFPSMCANGQCVGSFADCPTRKTCPVNTILCTDGTCVANNHGCFDVPMIGTGFLCADGSQVSTTAKCPTQRVCTPGYVLCANQLCALQLSFCGDTALPNPNTCDFVCPDGSCAENALQCATGISCPRNYPVLCQDNICKTSSQSCNVISPCATGLTCPDGSCVGQGVACPTQLSCPQGYQRCSDGACVTNTADCQPVTSCPNAAPTRCPDGTCRINLDSCSTLVKCPSYQSLLCMDGTCVADLALCPLPTSLTCPIGQNRCFLGDCVTSASLCPSHTTCPTGYQRCQDGTCRSTTDTPTPCDNAIVQCPNGLIKCPTVTQGAVCKATLAECMVTIALCPQDQLVRCSDGSCRSNLLSCPVPIIVPDGLNPCPDNTFDVLGGCTTPVTCPTNTPYVCSDQHTCRTLPGDCSASATCPAGQPYLCLSSGVCMDGKSFLSDCKAVNPACPEATSIRCPSGKCANNTKFCTSTVLVDECPNRCRDNTCGGLDASNCISRTGCSVVAGYEACWNGFCAPAFMSTTSFCPVVANACPYDKRYRCVTTGECVIDSDHCDAPPTNLCKTGTFLSDGFCTADVTDLTNTYSASGCPWSVPYRCWDFRCVSQPEACWGAACPATAPVFCRETGFCTTTTKLCPVITATYCPSLWTLDEKGNAIGDFTRLVPCADGTCQQSSDFCRPIRPCLATDVRCEDGSCSETEAGCRMMPVCGGILPYRCNDGLCAASAGACRNPLTGCPISQPKACPNGACVDETADCNAVVIGDVSTCPQKCPDNGFCVDNLADCLNSVGCPLAKPLRCSTTYVCTDVLANCPKEPACKVRCWNNECKESIKMCTTSTYCPLDKPVRCENGECRKYPATASLVLPADKCPSVATCGGFICYSGQCVQSPDACSLVAACSNATNAAQLTFRCNDGSCAANELECGALQNTCPAGKFQCPNGECKPNSVGECPGIAIVDQAGVASGGGGGSSAGDTGTFHISSGCSATKPKKCFDGSCVDSYQKCTDIQKSILAATDSTSSALKSDTVEDVCANGDVLCSDGSCTRQAKDCPIIRPCAPNQKRCGDGSCADNECPARRRLANCPSGQRLCEDGRCRKQCLSYDGCGLDQPYHCWNRECGSSAAACGGTSGPVSYCISSCLAQVKAVQVTITLDASNPQETKFALSPGGKGIARNDPIIGISAPSGTISSSGGNNTQAIVQIRPVAESEMRGVGHPVHPSRKAEFGTDLTFAQSVVSVAFTCELPAGLVLTNGGLEVSATIDYSFTSDDEISAGERTWGKLQTWRDVCFAYMFVVPRLGYKRWQCVSRNRYSPPFAAASDSVDPWQVTARVPMCGVVNDDSSTSRIYAFIRSPRPNLSSDTVPVRNWLAQNLIKVLFGASAAFTAFAIGAYAVWRLNRYSKKHKQEAAKVVEQQEKLEDLRMHGRDAETADDGAVMNDNPMVLQKSDMQKMQVQRNQADLEKEQKALEEAAANRAEYMEEQEKEKKKEQEALERKRRELAAAAKANNQGVATRDEDVAPATQGPPPVTEMTRQTSARGNQMFQRGPTKKKLNN